MLRPAPGASATLERAREAGLDAFALPLFDVVAVDWQAVDPDKFDGVLLTSANALRHGGPALNAFRDLPAYAVGTATAAAARDLGFTVAVTGDKGVDRLLETIDPPARLVHFCGRDRLAPEAAAQEITALQVYESREIAPVEGIERLAGCVVLVHSPRAGRRLAELIEDRGAIAIAAISSEAASAAGEGWERVEAAREPSDGALLVLAKLLCNKEAGE